MQGQWIRIHPRPRRYPAASTTDWASRVLHLDDDFCVVNKPAGIPVQSHESNSAETVPRCMERALGIEHLWVSTFLPWPFNQLPDNPVAVKGSPIWSMT